MIQKLVYLTLIFPLVLDAIWSLHRVAICLRKLGLSLLSGIAFTCWQVCQGVLSWFWGKRIMATIPLYRCKVSPKPPANWDSMQMLHPVTCWCASLCHSSPLSSTVRALKHIWILNSVSVECRWRMSGLSVYQTSDLSADVSKCSWSANAKQRKFVRRKSFYATSQGDGRIWGSTPCFLFYQGNNRV